MTRAERYRRACEIFNECVETPVAERAALLDRACDGDAELRAQVEAMLARDDAEDAFGDDAVERVRVAVEEVVDGADTPADAPARIGQYAIRDLIGRGGMGVVYEGVQENPNRAVAVKVLRAGMSSPQLVQRFQREVQVLGRLHDPGIAHVYEAGDTVIDGETRPFVAMEYVDGPSIDEFVRERDLTPREILTLIARICDAVHHAHQRGVIHRDLKPGNILVTESTTSHGTTHGGSTVLPEGPWQPKVLDFGVARFTDDAGDGLTIQTQAGQLIGTIAYMSPEQLTGDTLDLDIRCDVYAIGVVMYELLSARTPFDVAGVPIAQAARVIEASDAPRLGSLEPSLRGDVETIVAKAMEKDRDRRYESAGALAADIRRHLGNEPIDARAATTVSQLRSFARRHRALAAGIGATIAALAVGLGGTSYFLAKSIRSDREAAARADDLEAVVAAQRQLQVVNARGLTTALQGELPTALRTELRAQGLSEPQITEAVKSFEATIASIDLHAVTMRTMQAGILRNRVRDAERLLAEQPVALATVLDKIGEASRRNGMTMLALDIFETAQSLLVQHSGATHPKALAAQRQVAMTLMFLRRDERALDLALDILTHLDDAEEIMSVRMDVITPLIRLGRVDEADAHSAAVLEYHEARQPPPRAAIATAQLYVAHVRIAQERYDDALNLLDETETLSPYGDAHPFTWLLEDARAEAHLQLDDHDAAEPALRATLDGRRALYGASHVNTLASTRRLASLLNATGRHEETLPLVHRALVYAETAVEVRADLVAGLLCERARAEAGTGRTHDARRTLEEARRRLLEDDRGTDPVDEVLVEIETS